MWIAVGTLVVCSIKKMRAKSDYKKMFEAPDGIGYKVNKRFNKNEIESAARVLFIPVTGDKKTMVINVIKKLGRDYNRTCMFCKNAYKMDGELKINGITPESC